MSTYNQRSFGGGMNLKVDDTRLDMTQYRTAFNVRNHTDTLVPVKKSVKDLGAPVGVKQDMLTFGDYIIMFAGGYGFFRERTSTGWQPIPGFKMSSSAFRYWVEAIPVSLTNYLRLAADETDASAGIKVNTAAGNFAGNVPGLLVQDGSNQPQFIYISESGAVTCRTTQTWNEWDVEWSPYTLEADKREYVPVGRAMKYVDGVLWIVSPDGNRLYRSVSGRPLDFVIAIDNNGWKAGDAETTAYSVGVGGITTLRALSDGSLFVSADGACFSVSKNMTPGALTIFGEYTFIRRFLFNATCLSDRGILDTLGDTRFIDQTGVKSFNAIEQLQNQGRNSVFTQTIIDAFTGIVQESKYVAAILFDNCELYAVNTVFGPAIAVYDAAQERWVGFDIGQTQGKRIKQFAKIESSVQKLYAITEDDELFDLYASSDDETAHVRTAGINSALVESPNGVVPKNDADLLKHELRPTSFRSLFTNITKNFNVSLTPFVNNRLACESPVVKTVKYAPPTYEYAGVLDLPEIDTQVENLFWTFADVDHGWKVFFILSWDGGSTLTQISATFKDETPMNPLNTQASAQ